MKRWKHIFGSVQTYSAKHKFPDHAENEVGPENVQTKKDHQHCVKEIIAKEGRVVENRVHPGAVDQPETQRRQKSQSLLDSTV